MIQGYPTQPSVLPGETLTLHVSTDAPQFRVDFYRQGQTLVFMGNLGRGWIVRQNLPQGQGRPNQDWGWPDYHFTIPGDWPSGAYIAMFIEGDGNGNQISSPDTSKADGQDAKALFVLKSVVPRTSASILYKLSLFTYHAYNDTGGGGLYGGSSSVTLHRPGGGTGGKTHEFGPGNEGHIDVYDRSSLRQTFAHWDVPFIVWLEKNGYRVDYCTDFDIHEDSNLNLLGPYALLLSVGHDEYWSDNLRTNIEAFIQNGGNVAFFSGNICWGHIEFIDPVTFKNLANWWEPQPPGPNNPENSLTGVSYRNAGGWWGGPRLPVGYKVQYTDHWVYEGTGQSEGKVFGENEYLIGYECDGAEFDRNQSNMSARVRPTGRDETPLDFVILGIGDVSLWDPSTGIKQTLGNKAATMGTYTHQGTVFTAATVDWARVLANGEPTVEQITRNVLNRLGGNPKGLATLSNLGGIVACDGFFSPDDSYRHTIVGTSAGSITEIFFNPQTRQGQAQLISLNGLLDLSAFYSNDDQYRHVIAATSDGTIQEIFYSPKTGQGQAVLANIPNVIRISGFFSSDDKYRHAIVATTDGNIHEIFYNPQVSQGQAVLGNFSGIVDVSAFFSTDDKYRHAIVATSNGNVYELYYNPQAGQGQTVLGNFPGVTKISAFYTTDDVYFNRRIIVATSNGRVFEIKYSPRGGIVRSLLWNTKGVTDICGFYSSDDKYRHVIVATSGGDVQELFYAPETAI